MRIQLMRYPLLVTCYLIMAACAPSAASDVAGSGPLPGVAVVVDDGITLQYVAADGSPGAVAAPSGSSLDGSGRFAVLTGEAQTLTDLVDGSTCALAPDTGVLGTSAELDPVLVASDGQLIGCDGAPTGEYTNVDTTQIVRGTVLRGTGDEEGRLRDLSVGGQILTGNDLVTSYSLETDTGRLAYVDGTNSIFAATGRTVVVVERDGTKLVRMPLDDAVVVIGWGAGEPYLAFADTVSGFADRTRDVLRVDLDEGSVVTVPSSAGVVRVSP
jgi:hypothetical protein